MKKLMFAVAAVAAGVALADVTSANVVGYTTTAELEANTFYLLGMNFEGTDAQPISIQNAVQGAIADSDMNKASVIYTAMAGGGWNQFWFQKDYWDEVADDEIPTWVWLTGAETGNKANVTIKPGEGFWYSTPVKTTVTIAGQVIQAGTKELTLAANTFTLCANPFPITLPLNDKTVFDWTTSGLTYNSDMNMAAIIYTSNAGGGWNQFWFQKDYWDEVADDEVPSWVWLTGAEAGNRANISLQIGEGFWMLNPTTTTVTFKK